jgi:hypothetical protein
MTVVEFASAFVFTSICLTPRSLATAAFSDSCFSAVAVYGSLANKLSCNDGSLWTSANRGFLERYRTFLRISLILKQTGR